VVDLTSGEGQLHARPADDVPDCQLTNIVKAAYGLDPAIVARVDIAAHRATALETPSAHVYWGDIPTPTF
jgi:hypothetical protein